ncbi:MAG: HlyC/CorC family transporter [Clostridia bacterium]|nr:HlyC/CorC family transporter [Clostridia bacterium]
MTQGDISTLILMAVLVIMSAYFSATETAFSTVNTTRLKTLADKGSKKAERVLNMAENYDKLLSTILVGNNIVNITLSSVATLFFIGILNGDSNTAATVSTVVTTVAVLIFGEISPKSLAKEAPESFAMFSAPILRIFIWVLTPVNFIFSLWKKLLSKIFKVKGDRSVTSDEIITFIDSVEEGGDLDEDESELLRSAVEFSDQEAADILTPRVDIVGVEEDNSKEEIAQVFTDTGYSRLPVYKDSLDNIVGIVHQKDFYDGPRVTAKPLSEIMKAPVYVTPGMKIHDILKLLQKTKSHVSVVTDEFGGTLGIVTMEDILEELVGDIWDEHDEVIEEFTKISEDTYRIKCTADLDEMFELFEIDGEIESDSVTVSGWVMEQIGRIPVEGDKFVSDGLDVTVSSTDGKRVLEITVTRLPEEDDDDEDDD